MTEPSDAEKKVQFNPFIVAAGNYAAYVYFPKTTNASTQTHITVYDGKTAKNIIIHKSEVRVEGQTSGEWVSLGTYALEKGTKSYVFVTNKNADGTVVADAVLFVPLK